MIRKIIIQVSWFISLMAISIPGFAQSKVVVIPTLGSDSTATLYGRAPSSENKALLFKWPGTGVEVRTHDTDAGDAIFNVRIVNTNPSGGSSFYIVNPGSSAGPLTPGSSVKQGGLIGASLLLVENKGSLGRMMRLDCFANVIAAGDDGFVQCMGVTAGSP